VNCIVAASFSTSSIGGRLASDRFTGQKPHA